MSLSKLYGIGIIALCSVSAHAGRKNFDRSHAEVTLGFPNGQVTVGKTWGTGNPEVIHETVIERPVYRDRDDDEDCHRVVVEERPRYEQERVTIIKHYPSEPRCERVVYRDRSYYDPERTVIVVPERHWNHHGHGNPHHNDWRSERYCDRD